MKTSARKHQKGSISILVALSLVALCGILGLAIDSGFGYLIKAKLDASVDGAAIAAGEAVTRGNNETEQIANAKQAAAAFFAANYPAGYLNSTATLATPSVVFNAGTVTINLSAQAQVPVTFMRTLGFTILNVSSTSEATRKTLDMAFVIDTTGSLNTGSVPAAVRSNAVNFLNNFDITNDRVALMHFAYGTVVDVPFNANARGFNRALMKTKINNYSFAGSTNSSEALWNARNQLNNVITQPSSLRVIVFLSDGAPNSFSSMFPTTAAATACSTQAGTIITGDSPGSGNPAALYKINQQQQAFSAPCYSNTASSFITALPAVYNAHPGSGTQPTFPIITNTPRVVTSTVNYANVNRAARNLLEAMAAQSRVEGTYVFTLGFGPALVSAQGQDGERGEDVLKCMANTSDSLARCYNPAQPVGVYCYAATTADLNPCFAKLASQILRITK